MPQYLKDHLKLHHMHFTEINELYVSLSLQAFSSGLVGIFVPIYIYTLGFSVSLVAMFYLVYILTNIIFFLFSAKLVGWYGPKHILTTSYILMFFYIILLYLLPTHQQTLFPAAIMGGIAADFFWMARHIDLAAVISQKRPTSQFSTLLIYLSCAEALAPLLGGVIATGFGIQYTLLGSSIGLLFAAYPLLKTPEPAIWQKTQIRLFQTAPLRHMAANIAMNAQTTVAAYLWPLFIFLIVDTYQNVGIIASFSLVLTVLTLHTLGGMGDKGENTKILKIGSNLRSGVHLIRMVPQTFAGVLGVNLIGDITADITSVPYSIRFYEGARKYGIAAYLVDMEIAGSIGKALPWLILFLGNNLFGLKITLFFTFIFAAVSMPLLRLIEPISPSKSE